MAERRNGDYPRFPEDCRRHRWLPVLSLRDGKVVEPVTHRCWWCGATDASEQPRG